MSDTLPCQSCWRPISAVAARCPLCGTHQSRDGQGAPAKPSATTARVRPRKVGVEQRVDAPEPLPVVLADDPDAGPFSGLVAPHPRSTPGERALQIALSIVALPLILSTFLLVGLLFTRATMRARQGLDLAPPSIASPLALAIGSLPLVLLIARAGAGPVLLAVLVATQWIALGARAYVRHRARRR